MTIKSIFATKGRGHDGFTFQEGQNVTARISSPSKEDPTVLAPVTVAGIIKDGTSTVAVNIQDKNGLSMTVSGSNIFDPAQTKPDVDAIPDSYPYKVGVFAAIGVIPDKSPT